MENVKTWKSIEQDGKDKEILRDALCCLLDLYRQTADDACQCGNTENETCEYCYAKEVLLVTKR